MSKTYVFHVSRGPGQHERFELTEDQLEPKHEKLLLGQLLSSWNNSPPRIQNEFMQKVVEYLRQENDALKAVNLTASLINLRKFVKAGAKEYSESLRNSIEKDYAHVRIEIDYKDQTMRAYDNRDNQEYNF